MGSAGEMNFSGPQTKLGAALDGARDELAGLPVAGVVMVTDGADTSDASLDPALLAMKAQRLPVFTVGVGSEQLPRDVQIDRVSTPRSVLKDASLLVDVVVRNTGFGGRTVTVDVEDEGRIIGSEKVQLPSDGSPAQVRVRAIASEPGPRLFKFKVSPQDGELVTQNNVRESLVNVRDVREQILYFEGEPRFEMKFLRRARRRRQEPRGRRAAAHGGQQVHAALRRRAGGSRGARRRIPEDARRTVQVPRPHPRQRRSRRVRGRSAADDCRVRRAARRWPADARRCAFLWRRRLWRHSGRRRAAAAHRPEDPRVRPHWSVAFEDRADPCRSGACRDADGGSRKRRR